MDPVFHGFCICILDSSLIPSWILFNRSLQTISTKKIINMVLKGTCTYLCAHQKKKLEYNKTHTVEIRVYASTN